MYFGRIWGQIHLWQPKCLWSIFLKIDFGEILSSITKLTFTRFILFFIESFPHPMQLAQKAFPFPYADLKSPFSLPRAKKSYFSTYTCPTS
jgi:hypothetical protein